MRKVVIAAFAALVSVTAARAEFPDRPVRLIVPFPPGGALDILARGMAPSLEARLNQPIVVDNKPGANGTLAFDLVAKAKPDGYTLLLGSASSLAVNPMLNPNVPYNPQRDFIGISSLISISSILIVNPSFEAGSVQQLIALAQASPGKISYGTPGNGNPNHIAGELFRSKTGVNLVHVPYKGAAFVITDIIAGHLPTAFVTLPAGLPHVRTGKVKALAVTAEKRSAAAPQIPTMAEAGVPGVIYNEWSGILAPAGTPQPVVARLHREFSATLSEPGLQARLVDQGFEPLLMSSEAYAALIRADIERMATLVRQLGIRAD
jgi:tripartite-type tricarboxylate transporter receptor subunit TctC